MPSLPAHEYRARLALHEAARRRLERHDLTFSATRLLTFGIGAALALFWWRGFSSPAWIGFPLVAFFILIRRHDVTLAALQRARRCIAFYERGLARIDDRWAGGGEHGDRFRDEAHLYANDLDLFGKGSLFELLSIARTRAGEETLAAWLKAPAGSASIRARQEAVSELTAALDLREELALAGSEVRAGVDTDALIGWAEGAAVLPHTWLRIMAALLTVAALGSATYWISSGDSTLFLWVVAAEVFFSIPQRRRIQQALHAAEGPARDLDVLAHVLSRVERDDFQSAFLRRLRQNLQTDGIRASVAIQRVHHLVELHDWQHNQFFAPIAAALLWGTHLAWAIESWRRAHGAHVGTWLRAVGEFEALSSLAAYRFEHPSDVWADIEEGGARFEGVGIGHPLIPAARMVRNDVHLCSDTALLVISGSNMSGKSTLLRTVGINAVLALAGAPVRATSLRLTPLAVGATLRIQDSLQEGRSRFYAELTRIRELSDVAAGPVPLLFLLDEIFQGTNSHDRLVGASGLLRNLLTRGAIGLVTTHDLALTGVADALAPRAANVHFEDHFEGAELQFDYRMKPGPVTRSNAIALMRMVGLDIDIDRA